MTSGRRGTEETLVCLSVKIARTFSYRLSPSTGLYQPSPAFTRRDRLSGYQSDGRRYLRRRLPPPQFPTRSLRNATNPLHLPHLSYHPTVVPRVLHNCRFINQPPAAQNTTSNPPPPPPPTHRRISPPLLLENSSISLLLSLIFRAYRCCSLSVYTHTYIYICLSFP